MFAYNLNSKDNPLATVWLAANLDKKLTKAQLLHTNICKTAKAIINGDSSSSDEINDDLSSLTGSQLETKNVLITSEPIALRLSGQLLYGIVKIYSRKERYLLDDVSDVLVKLKSIFKSNNLQSIIVPAGKTMMNINKSLLHDTVNEANIGNELLNPLNIDIDIESLINGHDDMNIAADYSIEAGRDIGDNLSSILTNANTKSSKIERKDPQILENKDKTPPGNYNEKDLDDKISNHVPNFGNSTYADDLNNNYYNQEEPSHITEHQELVLDFSNSYSVEKQNIDDNSIEMGRRSALERSKLDEDDASTFNFGNLLESDKLPNNDFQEFDHNMAVDDIQDIQNNVVSTVDSHHDFVDANLNNNFQTIEEKTSETKASNDWNSVFRIGPLETIEESKQDQQQKRDLFSSGINNPRKRRQRSKGVSKFSKFGGKKKILKDVKIEFSNEAFQSNKLNEVENSILLNKKKYIRDALDERRKLFCLKKFSSARNCFIETDEFKYLWNSNFKALHGSTIQNSEIWKDVQKGGDSGDEGTEEPHFEIGMDTELPTNYPNDSGFDFNLDFADNFNSGLVEDIVSEENHVGDVLESEEEEENKGKKEKETFFHKESANDFTSSLMDSSSNNHTCSINSEEELKYDDDTFADEISQTSQYNLPENQLNEGSNNDNSISKSTLKVADLLKNELSSNIKKNVTLNTVIELDHITKEPLSRTLKKQAARCLFELLVLATKDAITLKQDSLFGDISVKPKDNLYIL